VIQSAKPAYFTENQILAALDKSEYGELFSQLEKVSLNLGDSIYEADARIDHVYFPETAVFSMLATMEDGRTVEVGPVGNEGLVGLRVALGATTAPDRVLVHIAGTALRLKATNLKVELKSGQKALSHNITRYTRMLLAMTARTSACNKLHSLEQQLARWLLTMNDYVGNELRLTHDLMALTLGVRRAGVSVAANNFRTSGVIDYRRGQIHVVDRQGLKALACECYEVIKEEYDRLYADLSQGHRTERGSAG
jgi:CRP-like cAMP-binding protein